MTPERGRTDAGAAAPSARSAIHLLLLLRMLPHGGAALFFALLGVALTWPLAARLGTHIPGAGFDDNMVFLWNVWWMRQALASSSETLFHTPYLFHPDGVDLVLHTHMALNAFVAGTALAALPPVVALNLTTLVSGAMNGFATYLLAWRTVRTRLPAVAAGIFVAGSPALGKHLYGHFHLYSAWVLILFVLVLIESLQRRSRRWAIAAGLLLGAVAYADYYYFVYACVFVVCASVHHVLRPRMLVARPPVARRTADIAALAAAGAALVTSLLIWGTGGLVFDVAGVRVSMTSGRNLRALAAGLVVWWLWRRYRPRVTFSPDRPAVTGHLRLVALTLTVGAVMLAPVIAAAVDLWRAGGYVSQTYMWRSAPAGADIGSLVLGNPFNGVVGPWVMRTYAELGMDAFSGPLWFSGVPLLVIATWTTWRDRAAARLWLLVGGVFFVWTLGPYLLVFGMDTGVPLPQVLLRFVPVVANARIPTHAAVFVVLSLGLLLALALSSWRTRGATAVALAITGAVLADFWAAPVPMQPLHVPPLYTRLAGMPPGALLELPIGMRDGFGEEGRFDPNVLYYQTVHGKPIAGGYISRLSPAVRTAYRSSPFGTLLRLSAGAELDPAQDAAPGAVRDFIVRSGIEYVVVNGVLSSPALREFVGDMQLTPVESDESRQLFRVD